MITVQSFGFKKSGIPLNSNLVIDVRNIRNPHDNEALRNMTGNDKEVIDYIEVDKNTEVLFVLICSMVYLTERKDNDFVISVGCTGGKHRSVYFANRIAKVYGTQAKHIELEPMT